MCLVVLFGLISTLPGALGAQVAWEVLAPSERFLGFRVKTLRVFHLIDNYKVRKRVGRHIYIGPSLNTYRYLEKVREG